MAKSKKYKLNKADGLKILKGAGVALGGSLLVYVAEVLPQVDFGVYTALAVAFASVLLNAGRKSLEGK